jgi:hypothetical protein
MSFIIKPNATDEGDEEIEETPRLPPRPAESAQQPVPHSGGRIAAE